MKIKRIAMAALIILPSLVVWMCSDEHRRWLLINRGSAEDYAAALLEGNTDVSAPSAFVDYSISASRGVVLFSPHSLDGPIYAYSPTGVRPPEHNGLAWRSLGRHWFVADLN